MRPLHRVAEEWMGECTGALNTELAESMPKEGVSVRSDTVLLPPLMLQLLI